MSRFLKYFWRDLIRVKEKRKSFIHFSFVSLGLVVSNYNLLKASILLVGFLCFIVVIVVLKTYRVRHRGNKSEWENDGDSAVLSFVHSPGLRAVRGEFSKVLFEGQLQEVKQVESLHKFERIWISVMWGYLGVVKRS